MSLVSRSVRSANYKFIASAVGVVVQFARAVILARLLEIEVFGVYAGAGAIVATAGVIPLFGLAGAFMHRNEVTENEQEAAKIHFTLKTIFTTAWLLLFLLAAYLLADSEMRLALMVLALATFVFQMVETPRIMLIRRVEHRRLALVDLVGVVVSSVIAIVVAVLTGSLWALLATNITVSAIWVVMIYFWRPVWKPSFKWNWPAVSYFLRFGRTAFGASVLQVLLTKVDDIYTKVVLGTTAMGLYSKAYRFASIPAQLTTSAVGPVAAGAYAELKGDRIRLSKMFFRTNSFLARLGFLLAGLAVLIAPEFIYLVLGEKWMPMLVPFQLMLAYSLFSPLKSTTFSLFGAVGKPHLSVWTGAAQLVVLIVGILMLSPKWGISGVALAVDVMMLSGIAGVFWLARREVDFSVLAMFGPPLIAMVLALSAGLAVHGMQSASDARWVLGLSKGLAYLATFVVALVALEYGHLRNHILPLVAETVRGFRSTPVSAGGDDAE